MSTQAPPRANPTAEATRAPSTTRTLQIRSATAPEIVWVPFATAVLILAAGAMSLATKQGWLFAALGPTAVMQARGSSDETARSYNVVVGHFIGIAAGFLAVVLLGAGDAPRIITSGTIPVVRVWASALAMAITMVGQLSLRAIHAPAAATALLVTLGVVRLSSRAAFALAAGVVTVALLGEWLRRIRGSGVTR